MSGTSAKDRALLKTLLDQERRLQFESFDNETAIALGLSLIERGRAESLPIAVDVTRNQQQIFRGALAGTSIDNDFWIKGKNAVVYRFGHSSLYIGTTVRMSGKTLEEKYLVDSREFRAHGGAFPVFVKSVGLVGTITVSGLAQQDDHRLVVWAIARYLGSTPSGKPRRAKAS